MQVASTRQVTTRAVKFAVRDLAASMPDTAWQIYSAGDGAKGYRFYSWALISIEPEPVDDDSPASGEQMLLMRRNDTTGELAYHLCFTPAPVPMATLVRVAGQRWRIEEDFQAAMGLVGLDQQQVRRWDSWHRWTTLAMLTHAFLTVLATTTRRDTDHRPAHRDHRGRGPSPVQRPRRHHHPKPRADPRLVLLATTTPSQIPHRALHGRITAGQHHDLRL